MKILQKIHKDQYYLRNKKMIIFTQSYYGKKIKTFTRLEKTFSSVSKY